MWNAFFFISSNICDYGGGGSEGKKGAEMPAGGSEVVIGIVGSWGSGWDLLEGRGLSQMYWERGEGSWVQGEWGMWPFQNTMIRGYAEDKSTGNRLKLLLWLGLAYYSPCRSFCPFLFKWYPPWWLVNNHLVYRRLGANFPPCSLYWRRELNSCSWSCLH